MTRPETTAPPLLQKMLEVSVGELMVQCERIIEPKTGCRVAWGFPDKESAIAAAMAMNEVADWFGIIKTRAEGHRPNCQAELQRIAQAYGGFITLEAGDAERRCAEVVARFESRT